MDSSAKGAPDLKSNDHGESLPEGSLVSRDRVGASRRAKVARQGVPVARLRGLRPGPTRTSAGHVRPSRVTEATPWRGSVHHGDSWYVAPTTVPLGVEEAVRSIDATDQGIVSFVGTRVHSDGAEPEAAVAQARAERSRIDAPSRCSLITSRLQRLVTGAFLSKGQRRLGAEGCDER